MRFLRGYVHSLLRLCALADVVTLCSDIRHGYLVLDREYPLPPNPSVFPCSLQLCFETKAMNPQRFACQAEASYRAELPNPEVFNQHYHAVTAFTGFFRESGHWNAAEA